MTDRYAQTAVKHSPTFDAILCRTCPRYDGRNAKERGNHDLQYNSRIRKVLSLNVGRVKPLFPRGKPQPCQQVRNGSLEVHAVGDMVRVAHGLAQTFDRIIHGDPDGVVE